MVGQGVKMATAETAPRFLLGIAMGRGGSVAHVLRGSPADRARVRAGDKVISLNNGSPGDFGSVRKQNKISFKRKSRTLAIRMSALDLRNKRDVLSVLLGIGDRVQDSSFFKTSAHCDSQCNCVDGDGYYCSGHYTFEGAGPNGGVLLTKHCQTVHHDYDTDKTTYDPPQKIGPREYF
jgi:hypothetical protein